MKVAATAPEAAPEAAATSALGTALGTIGAAVRAAARRFDTAGLDNAHLDARLLVAHAAGLDPERLRLDPDRPLDPAARGRLEALIERRAAGREPVSRILGTREFWSLPFALSPDTLDPRPDSETLVEAVLARVADRRAPLRLLDLGTGTGCLLLALLSELPEARGTGLDIAPGAVETARANAAVLGLDARATFVAGDWSANVGGPDVSRPDGGGPFDCIVGNPPYIPSTAIAALQPEVARHDPRIALDGGADGLDAYRAIAARLPGWIAPGGTVALEIGAGQEEAVADLLAAQGLTVAAVVRDLAGRPRCAVVEAPAKGRKMLKKPVARGARTC